MAHVLISMGVWKVNLLDCAAVMTGCLPPGLAGRVIHELAVEDCRLRACSILIVGGIRNAALGRAAFANISRWAPPTASGDMSRGKKVCRVT